MAREYRFVPDDLYQGLCRLQNQTSMTSAQAYQAKIQLAIAERLEALVKVMVQIETQIANLRLERR